MIKFCWESLEKLRSWSHILDNKLFSIWVLTLSNPVKNDIFQVIFCWFNCIHWSPGRATIAISCHIWITWNFWNYINQESWYDSKEKRINKNEYVNNITAQTAFNKKQNTWILTDPGMTYMLTDCQQWSLNYR